MSEEIKDTVEEKAKNTKKVIAKAVSRDMVKDKVKKAATKQIPVWMIGIAFVIVIALVAVMAIAFRPKEPAKPEYVTYSVLENIVNVSELSTFEAVYNGVAQVANEKNPEKIDYYDSYEAKVKVGIDFEKIALNVDEENKHIVVTIPAVDITDVNVDIASLDYIFVNDKANDEDTLHTAYKACEDDVKNESQTQDAIFELAQQNAENYVKALVLPFVQQMDEEYSVEFNQEG